MQGTEAVLNAYKLADDEHRIFLFLEYRDLRERFTEIDADELFFEGLRREGRAANSWLSKLRRAAGLRWSAG